MRPRLSSLVSVLLLLGLVPPAASEDGLLDAPPFRLGAVAVYAAPAGELRFEVAGGLRDVLAKDGSTHPAWALDVTRPWGSHVMRSGTALVSHATGNVLLERWDCGAAVGSDCQPLVVLDWRPEDLPVALGAGALQGRSFRVGETWDLGERCGWCTATPTATVEPPTSRSPSGTRYTVVLRGLDPREDAWNAPVGRIHMGDAPFPLLAELQDGDYALTTFTEGTDAVPLPELRPLSTTPPLQARPFARGVPPEGTPLPGHPELHEARVATGDDEVAELRPARTAVRIDYSFLQGTPSDPVTSPRWVLLERDGALHTRTAYSSRPHPLAEEGRLWLRTTEPLTSSLPPCSSSIPLWDGVRHAGDLPVFGGFDGYKFTCDRLTVYGEWYAPPAHPSTSFGTSMALDPASGNAIIGVVLETLADEVT